MLLAVSLDCVVIGELVAACAEMERTNCVAHMRPVEHVEADGRQEPVVDPG